MEEAVSYNQITDEEILPGDSLKIEFTVDPSMLSVGDYTIRFSSTYTNNLILKSETGNIKFTIIDATDNINDIKDNINAYNIYPNPITTNTFVKYTIKEKSNVIITIYDNQGKLITSLINEIQFPGEYSIPVNAESMFKGEYFISIKINNDKITKKIIHL